MPTEILSGLWIGNVNDNYNEQFFKDNLITIVINCTIDQGFLDIPNLKKIRLPLSADMDPNRDIYLLKENKEKIISFIHKNIEEENILVCCYNGLTISPLIVAIYMMEYGDISKDNIREIIRSKNDQVCLDYDLSLFTS
jgi:hypothetical protein